MLFDEGRNGPLLGVALALIVATVGCEQETYEIKHPAGSEQRANEPRFTWREALRESPGIARGWLGQLEGCQPKRQLPALSPEFKGYFPDGSRRCRFPDSNQREDALYHIDSILYAKQTTTAVFLRINEQLPLTLESFEKFYIPDFPIVRRRAPEWDGQRRHVLSTRMKYLDRDLDRGAAIAVDAIAEPDDPDTLALLRIGALSEWPYALDHVELRGPQSVSDESILPATTAGDSIEDAVSLRIGRDTVEVAPLGRYPLRINGDEPEYEEVQVDREIIEGRAPAEDSWRSKAAILLETWTQEQENLGYDPYPVSIHVFATRTVPYVTLIQAMEGLEPREGGAFSLGARRLPRLGFPFSDFASTRVVPVGFESSDGLDPTDPEAKKPHFNVRARSDGLDVWSEGKLLEPIQGCPDSGPTLCLVEEIDPLEAFKEARQLHDNGKLADSERRLREGLDAYDWSRLYEFALALKREHPGARRVYVRSESELPLALAFRAIETVRGELAFEEPSDCIDEVSEEQTIADAIPCVSEAGEPVELFDDPTLVYDPALTYSE